MRATDGHSAGDLVWPRDGMLATMPPAIPTIGPPGSRNHQGAPRETSCTKHLALPGLSQSLNICKGPRGKTCCANFAITWESSSLLCLFWIKTFAWRTFSLSARGRKSLWSFQTAGFRRADGVSSGGTMRGPWSIQNWSVFIQNRSAWRCSLPVVSQLMTASEPL